MAKMSAKYKGSNDYIASDELMNSVNIAIALQKPLLIKGEPGTGKTMLAQSIADSLGMDLIIWNIKSTTKAQEGLYVYDTVQRLYAVSYTHLDVYKRQDTGDRGTFTFPLFLFLWALITWLETNDKLYFPRITKDFLLSS